MLALLEMLMPGASRPAADKAPGTGRHVSLRSRAQGGLWRGWGCSLGGGQGGGLSVASEQRESRVGQRLWQ